MNQPSTRKTFRKSSCILMDMVEKCLNLSLPLYCDGFMRYYTDRSPVKSISVAVDTSSGLWFQMCCRIVTEDWKIEKDVESIGMVWCSIFKTYYFLCVSCRQQIRKCGIHGCLKQNLVFGINQLHMMVDSCYPQSCITTLFFLTQMAI